LWPLVVGLCLKIRRLRIVLGLRLWLTVTLGRMGLLCSRSGVTLLWVHWGSCRCLWKRRLRRLILVRRLISTEWTLRRRWPAVAWRRGISSDYWISLLLWRSACGLVYKEDFPVTRHGIGLQQARSRNIKKKEDLLNMWWPLLGTSWRIGSSCLILCKSWLLCWLLSILIRRLLAVRRLAIWWLTISIWLLLERRCTRHGPAPRHPTRSCLLPKSPD
jgi:hypothetical protein